MSECSLTIKTKDTMRMKTMIVLADIVIKSDVSNLYLFEAALEIGFFADMFRQFLSRDDSILHDDESLVAMIRSMEGIVTKMRAMLEEDKAA